MQARFKLIFFFVAASMVFSGVNCSSTPPGEAVANRVADAGNTEKLEYPPMPAEVMSADIKSLDGSSFKLESKKGTVVLVNLWATWCGPCIKEMPELVALHSELNARGFEVLGLNVDDEDKGLIESFAKDQNLNYPLGWTADGQLNDLVKISRRSGIPQSFLIDRNGRLRGTFFSASDAEVTKLKETARQVVSE